MYSSEEELLEAYDFVAIRVKYLGIIAPSESVGNTINALERLTQEEMQAYRVLPIYEEGYTIKLLD